MIPLTSATMDRNQKQTLKHKAQHSKQLWADPENIIHGTYLAEVINEVGIPVRVSELDFTLVDTHEELKIEIEDENNIKPLLVSSEKVYKSNTIPLHVQFNKDCEIACLKVEHLLYPKLYKIFALVRTFEHKQCTIETFNDSTIVDTAHFVNYHQLPKIVTRARITVNDEELNNLEVTTNTFSCR